MHLITLAVTTSHFTHVSSEMQNIFSAEAANTSRAFCSTSHQLCCAECPGWRRDLTWLSELLLLVMELITFARQLFNYARASVGLCGDAECFVDGKGAGAAPVSPWPGLHPTGQVCDGIRGCLLLQGECCIRCLLSLWFAVIAISFIISLPNQAICCGGASLNPTPGSLFPWIFLAGGCDLLWMHD